MAYTGPENMLGNYEHACTDCSGYNFSAVVTCCYLVPKVACNDTSGKCCSALVSEQHDCVAAREGMFIAFEQSDCTDGLR